MTTRLIAIGITGLIMMGYVPRWLPTGQFSWVVWAAAAAVVLGAPRSARFVWRRLVGRRRAPAVAAR